MARRMLPWQDILILSGMVLIGAWALMTAQEVGQAGYDAYYYASNYNPSASASLPSCAYNQAGISCLSLSSLYVGGTTSPSCRCPGSQICNPVKKACENPVSAAGGSYTGSAPQPLQTCGNGKLDPGEVCDGNLSTKTCMQLGFRSGTPRCQMNPATSVACKIWDKRRVQKFYGATKYYVDIVVGCS